MMAITAQTYEHAERAAGWCERGDDFAEARAVRALVADHQALRLRCDQLTKALQERPCSLISPLPHHHPCQALTQEPR